MRKKVEEKSDKLYRGHAFRCGLNNAKSYPAFRYVQALEDRITVIFSTVFKDADDVIIGKIFMQVSAFLSYYS